MTTPENARFNVECRISMPTTAQELLDYRITEPKNRESPTNLGQDPLIVIEENMANGRSAYTAVINRRLRGRRQNQVYWEIAPANVFGLDFSDYVSDHTRMLTKDLRYDSTIQRHESLGKPWKIYIRYGPGQLVSIQSHMRRPHDPYLIPVIRWERKGHNLREFIYSPFMYSEEGKKAVKTFLGKNVPDSDLFQNILDPTLGLYVLALFSPNQRKDWPATAGINGQGHQTQGSTQAPLRTLMQEKELTKSPFLLSAELHV